MNFDDIEPIAQASATKGTDGRANGATEAWGIIVDNRWFFRISRRHVLTAWSLAGAKLFVSLNDTADAVARIRKHTNRSVWIRRVNGGAA